MADEDHNRPELNVIRGRLLEETWLGDLHVVAAPMRIPPFPIDAIAAEEDTFLVLSADKEVREPTEPLVRIMTRLIETRPETPGTVVVKGRRPLKFLLIIHDFNQDPSCREEWVAEALDAVFMEAENRGLRSLGMPLIGTAHGAIDTERSVALIARAIGTGRLLHLKQLWLVAHRGTARHVLAGLLSEYSMWESGPGG